MKVHPLGNLIWLAVSLPATAQTADEWIARANADEMKGKTPAALSEYLEADKMRPNRVEILVKIAKQYGDMMTDTKDEAQRKQIGEKSLGYSRQALAADGANSDAHLSVAISLGKLVEFMGSRQRVETSREIKSEADKALQLDPRSDYAHHLLGRWNQELADMGVATRTLAKIIYGGLPEASYAEALNQFQKARDLRPDRLIHQIEIGRTLAMLGRKQEAKASLEKSLAQPNRDKDDEAAKGRGRETLKNL